VLYVLDPGRHKLQISPLAEAVTGGTARSDHAADLALSSGNQALKKPRQTLNLNGTSSVTAQPLDVEEGVAKDIHAERQQATPPCQRLTVLGSASGVVIANSRC
jgi:hypothetical protein